MSAFRVCPTNDPSTTRMEFDYYNVESGEKFEEYYKFVRQVAIEDYELCENAQYNLEKGIYAEGILNPVKETGVACKSSRFLPKISRVTDMWNRLSTARARDGVGAAPARTDGSAPSDETGNPNPIGQSAGSCSVGRLCNDEQR